jgi:ABC-2 type transport system ATP-binding protein
MEISIKDVDKYFGRKKILDHVSLSVGAGQICGLVGYNGSGKTVLFKCICGFYRVDAGEIRIQGKRMGQDMELLENVGIIIENPAFMGARSGYANLEFLYRIRNKKNREYLRAILEKVGLDPDSQKRVRDYSMGMKQRLAIAQAIMEEPDILILDEPMNGLDRQGVEDMRELFLEQRKAGKTILMASHNREDIDILCDAVYEMDHGRLTRLPAANL